MADRHFVEGSRFSSYHDFKEALEDFQKRTLTQFVRVSTCKLGDGDELFTRFRYHVLRFECKQGQKHKQAKADKLFRPQQRSYKIGCPASLNVRLNRPKKGKPFLKISKLKTDHKGHEASRERMSSTPSAKQTACDVIDRESGKLRALSLDIWEHPELCFEEHHAHQVITDFLEERGFQVERSYVLDTAFRVILSSNDATADMPHIGVMCEYDALPGIGHACGHNLIAILGVSVTLAIKEAFEQAGVKGKLTLFGCPAEEGGGGKIDLIEAGALRDLDLAMMAHPSQFNLSKPVYVAMTELNVRYEGMESHAGSFPWDGINALDAAVLCYQNVSCMRQQMKPTWRVHGIFTKAGEKPNIIPGVAELQFYARAPSSKELQVLKEKLIGCVHGAAVASGCKVVYRFGGRPYNSLISNDCIASLYVKNGESLGIKFENDPTKLMKQGGSTDMGNVSRVLPSIHPKYSLNTSVAGHTVEFREIAKTEESHKVTLEHAKALAMAAIDIYRDPSVVTKIKEDFETQMANEN